MRLPHQADVFAVSLSRFLGEFLPLLNVFVGSHLESTKTRQRRLVFHFGLSFLLPDHPGSSVIVL